jgi:hypothetical protein
MRGEAEKPIALTAIAAELAMLRTRHCASIAIDATRAGEIEAIPGRTAERSTRVQCSR